MHDSIYMTHLYGTNEQNCHHLDVVCPLRVRVVLEGGVELLQHAAL
jgi:hypothetical protein